MDEGNANTLVVAALMRDVIGRGRTDLLASLVAEEHVHHSAFGDHYGPDGVRIDVDAWRSAFPDLSVVVYDLFAVNDRVVRRFLLRGTHCGPVVGIAATGAPVEISGIAIDRLVNHRLVESWVLLDLYGLTRQLIPDAGSGHRPAPGVLARAGNAVPDPTT